MGCLNSKEKAPRGGSNRQQSGAAEAPKREWDKNLDPAPDFGLADQYEVRELLGEGGSGQTWLCRDLEKKKMVAIKFIKRAIPRIVLPMLMHEIKIQAELGDGHVNLVSAKAVVLTDTHLGIVMEYASGGNLTAYVTEKWETSAERDGLFLSEDEARYFFRQYIEAVEFLHANHVAHRDLKLDNIVLDGSTPPRIKVCDFGFAKNWDDEANMYTQIGTPVYMCPQLISCKHNSIPYDATKADIWACGVLLFVMLLGMFPYDHTEHPDPNSSDAHIEVWMQQNKFSWRESPTVADGARKLSLECQDLLDKMFERDEKKRITIERIKQHRWYRKPVPDHLQAALDKIREEQGERASLLQGVTKQQSKTLSAQRDKELEELLEESGNDGASSARSGSTPFRRIDLSRAALQATALANASMHGNTDALRAVDAAAVGTSGAASSAAPATATASASASGGSPAHSSPRKAAPQQQTLQNGSSSSAPGPSGTGPGHPPTSLQSTLSSDGVNLMVAATDNGGGGAGREAEQCAPHALAGGSEVAAVKAVAAMH